MFLFVPNICNAQCYFCYIEPALSREASLTAQTLTRLKQFLSLTKRLGFTEYRLTGGEPLVFRNFASLVEIFNDENLGYTLLTNGLNLQEWFPALLKKRPNKITISYHSRRSYEKVFGVSGNIDELEYAIKFLLNEGINISVTILLLPENRDEIINLVNHLQRQGVRSFKFIYPNLKEMGMSYFDKFEAILSSLNKPVDVDFRHSDKSIGSCLLKERGFVSLSLPDFTLYNCCTTVRYGQPYVIKDINLDAISKIIMSIYEDTREVTSFPCQSYTTFCPISLTNKRTG